MWGRSMNWRQGSEGETQGHVGEIAALAARVQEGDTRSRGEDVPPPEPLKLFLASEEDKANKSKIY